MTFKLKSRSPKSDQVFVSLDIQSWLKPIVQLKGLPAEILFWTFQSVIVNLKKRSTSPKPNQLLTPSKQCIYASLVKIHPLAQRITHRHKSMWMRMCTPIGSASKQTCPPPFACEDIISQRSLVKNKANLTNLYPPTKSYLRETCKSQNINPIYLTLSSASFRS